VEIEKDIGAEIIEKLKDLKIMVDKMKERIKELEAEKKCRE